MNNELVNEVIEWSSNYESDIDNWLKYCRKYLENYKWNEKAINDFIKWGKNGYNNKLLQFPITLLDVFDEINYCSDRMTLDRLFRCHTAYWNYRNNKEK